MNVRPIEAAESAVSTVEPVAAPPAAAFRSASLQTIRWLTLLGMTVALAMLVFGSIVLFDARQDAWRQAEQSTANLVLALERDIARNINVYDLSLQGAIDALKKPGIDEVSPEIRHAAIFDRAASAEFLGSLLVLNDKGDIIADSTAIVPHQLNFADRDYFIVHRDTPDVGLFVSRPFRSRLRGGDASMAISRRVSGPDGRFAGIVSGTLRLAYFQDLFVKLQLGADSSVTLARPDGRLVVRSPQQDGDLDRDMYGAETFKRFAIQPSGQFVAKSAIDGVTRFYTYRQIGDLPLLLNVALSVDEIYRPWWRKAIGIGSTLIVLCLATVVLCLLFRREMQRRIVAEDSLRETAGRLSVMAATDGLTGLANRRAFEADLLQEWRRAIRNETPLALLILDADHFKAYNDRYGHQEGDDVLRKLAACIQRTIRRPGDFGGRYGGEEFVALLPDTELAGAINTAERICQAIREMRIEHLDSPEGTVTVSIGVSVMRPNRGDSEAVLVREADAALYEAKRTGRARYCVWVAPAAAEGARPVAAPG